MEETRHGQPTAVSHETKEPTELEEERHEEEKHEEEKHEEEKHEEERHEEEKHEETSSVVQDMALDFFNLMVTCLDDPAFITLGRKEVKFIRKMMVEKPEIFHLISKDINDILEDNTISLVDIPKIIHVISALYANNFLFKNVKVIEIVRFSVYVILQSGILPLNGLETRVIECVVDTSLKLLELSLPVVKRRTWKFFQWMGCCKTSKVKNTSSELGKCEETNK